MLQYGILALLVICGSTANAGYSSNQQSSTFTGTYGGANNNGNSAGASAGTSNGVNGNTAGGSYGGQFPYYPNNGAFNNAGQGQSGDFPQFPQFPFAQPQFNAGAEDFWKQFSQNFQNAATMTYASPGAHAYAYASAAPLAYSLDLYQQQLAHQQALFHQFQSQAQGGYFGAGANGNNGGAYAPNFASSSGGFGPGGVQQTASIIPANPDSPNVDTRFGGDDKPLVTVSAGPTGFQGVSTSSFSSSSDVNGQKTNHREASTSVNDNGKVTTYTVRS